MKDFLEASGVVLKVAGIVVGCVIGVLVVAFLFAALLIVMISPLKRAQCKDIGLTVGYQTQYRLLDDACFLKIDGQWIPSRKWIKNTGN